MPTAIYWKKQQIFVCVYWSMNHYLYKRFFPLGEFSVISSYFNRVRDSCFCECFSFCKMFLFFNKLTEAQFSISFSVSLSPYQLRYWCRWCVFLVIFRDKYMLYFIGHLIHEYLKFGRIECMEFPLCRRRQRCYTAR